MSLFSDRLKYLREEYRYSLQELADKCGVSKSSIHLYELGTRKPKRETLEELCSIFNVDMDYLLGKSDIKNSTAYLIGYNSLAEAYEAGVDIDAALKRAIQIYRRATNDLYKSFEKENDEEDLF